MSWIYKCLLNVQEKFSNFLRETIRFFLRVWRWAVSLNIRKIIKKNPNKSWARASSLIECSEVSFLQRIMYLPGCVVTELCTCRDMLLRNCLPAGMCCNWIVYLPGCVVTELCTCRDVLCRVWYTLPVLTLGSRAAEVSCKNQTFIKC